MKTETGIHTFSLSTKSSYTEIQNIVEQVPCIAKPDKYRLNVSLQIVKFKAVGVEIHLHQSLVHPSWIKLIVNPSSLLAGEYCPTELLCKRKELALVKRKLRKILDQCRIDRKLKEFALSRADLTENRYCDSGEEVLLEVKRFRKSFLMPAYKAVPPGKWRKSAVRSKDANSRSWTISCKSCEFSVYDKTYELAIRHNVGIDNHILRRELRLERKRIVRLTRHSSWEDQLAELLDDQEKIMGKFLHRLHQDCERLVGEEEARQIIDNSSYRTKTKKQMRELVELAAERETLEDVRRKMRLKRERFRKLLDRFCRLGINPIPREALPQKDEESWFVLKNNIINSTAQVC